VGATRFFVSGVHAAGDIATLAADDARKLLVVLRKVAGAPLEIVDSSGRTFAGRLIVDGSSARAELERELVPRRADTLRLTLAQGIPKGQKMDFVVEKATELGVAAIVPFASERTQGGDRGREGKVERWRRLAKAAAQQCGRTEVPTVEQPVGFAELLASIGRYHAALIPWELEGGAPLRERLPALLDGVRDVLVIIGPEGGLAAAEVAAARERGARAISLGSRIFRTETAGLVACSALLYEAGDL
jgi:16S rRNA (uracil1498-N3)-methyltransferase